MLNVLGKEVLGLPTYIFSYSITAVTQEYQTRSRKTERTRLCADGVLHLH